MATARSEGPMVLPRAFSLLRLLAAAPQGLNLSALANHLDVPKSSLSSTLKALTEQELLSRRGTLYFLGSESYALASVILAGRTIRQIARPHLEKVQEVTGETSLLAQLDVDSKFITCIDLIESEKTIRYSVPIAARRGLYSSAAGQVFLADLTERARQAYYRDADLDKLTENTATDTAELEKVVAKVREIGVAVTWGTYSPDAVGFAAPVRDSDGALVAALSLGVPLSRAEREQDRYVEVIRDTAADISRILGYRSGGAY